MGALEDYSKAISDALTEEVIDETKASDYAVFTKEHDVIEPLTPGEVPEHIIKNMQESVEHMLGALQKDLERAVASLPGSEWLYDNVDGESVQIAANRLMRRREARKILMVLSDGHPACPGNRTALRAHLKRSVKEAESWGVDVLGIGINSDAPQQFYGKFVLLKEVSQLPSVVMGELKRLLMRS